MFKFKIYIVVTEDENGLHQNQIVKPIDDGNYNSLVVVGALEQAKLELYKSIQSRTEGVIN